MSTPSKESSSGKEATPRSAADIAYTAASDYLKTIGFVNVAEISRVLDIAMNPASMNARRNVNARLLDVEKDMRPVVDWLADQGGVKVAGIYKIVSGHPPVLSYPVARIEAWWSYMSEGVGIPAEEVGGIVAERPNLLGLDVDQNLRKIVEYLKYVETDPATIIKYLKTSI